MNTKHKDLISLLAEQVNEAFFLSKSDRRKLHDIEWEGGQNSPSILGETEVRASNIFGYATQCLKPNFKEINKVVDGLKKDGIYDSSVLLTWLLNEGDDFNQFTLYIQKLEHLRLSMIDLLKKEVTLGPVKK